MTTFAGKSLRDIYAEMSVEGYYESGAPLYDNPHKDQVRKLLAENYTDLSLYNVLDLACGDGLVTSILKDLLGREAPYTTIIGCDPYMNEEYERHTNRRCLNMSFKDIVVQGLKSGLRSEFACRVDGCIICSFGLHLCEKSLLPDLTWRLSEISDTLVVISPTKFPYLGTPKVEKFALTSQGKRVHYRVYDLPILWHIVREGL
jgi:hypothetical protein